VEKRGNMRILIIEILFNENIKYENRRLKILPLKLRINE